MDRARHLRNYDLHSWSGFALGLFIYVVCFTGCFALFYHEIQSWEDPARRLEVAEQHVGMNDRFLAWIDEKTGEDEVDFVRFGFPSEIEPYFSAYLITEDEDHNHDTYQARWDTATGEELPERGTGLSEWLLDFHRDLMWPQGLGGRTVGRTLVGIAGVILMLSIVTGVVAHTKIFQELFTLRYLRSMRLKWQDTHKVLGLWGLPFYSTMAFTGAVLGVVAILAPIVALLTFKGDQEALIEAVLGAPREASGEAAIMISVDDLAGATHPESGAPVEYLVFNHWGDKNAFVDVYFEAKTKLSIIDGYQIDGVSGEPVEDSAFEDLSLATRAVNALAPLHYGTYGGIALKFIYFILGLSLAIITALGLMMWVERRLHGNVGERSERVYLALGRVTAGATMGLPLATAAVFCLDKLYLGAEASRMYWTGVSYFIAWGGVIAYAFVRRNDYAVVREMMIVTGVLFTLLPVLNAVATNDAFFAAITSSHKISALVDVTLFIMGACTIFVATKLPKERVETSRRRVVSAPSSDGQLASAPAE